MEVMTFIVASVTLIVDVMILTLLQDWKRYDIARDSGE